ncbi:MAG TPA: SDR family oxidoreductase [bacterium]|nr:SDR family oxidoreductase [bacterium]
MRLQDQTTVITGGGRGIGRATALAFAREGAHVVVTARSEGEIAAVADEVRGLGRRALAVPADVAKEADVDELVRRTEAEFGRIDILVNNAGVIDFSPLADAPTEMWDRIMSVNLRGVFLVTRAVLPVMRRARRGNIVMVSAIGSFGGGGIAPIYRASKAALNNIAEAFAQETLGQGIRVNTVCPAETDTRLNRMAYPSGPGHAVWMRPEDIADVILFLASDQSRAMTGATLVACGSAKLSRWG